MKLSWGYRILFIYLAFVSGIIFLVFKASGERYDMVTDNYYEQELKYQEVIDQKSRVAALSAPLSITHANDQLRIGFPPELKGIQLKGQVFLYRPSDEKSDIKKSFVTSNGQFNMVLPSHPSGMYELKLSWEDDSQQFYYEQKIFF